MDVYSNVKSLFPEIIKHRKSRYVDIFNDDIDYSISSGEALMKIKYHLKELLLELDNPSKLTIDCKKIIDSIEDIL